VYAHSFDSGTFLAKCGLNSVGKIVVESMYVVIKRNFSKLLGWRAENWVIADVFVPPICFRNVSGQVPDPGGIVIIQAQS